MEENTLYQYDEEIVAVILSIITPDNKSYIEAAKYIFAIPPNDNFYKAAEQGNFYLCELILNNIITSRTYEIIERSPELDTPIFINYYITILKAINVLLFEDNFLSDEQKFAAAKFMKENTQNKIFTHNLNDDSSVSKFLEFLERQYEKHKNSDKGSSLHQLLKESEINQKQNCIFESNVINKIDSLIRLKYIPSDSPPLIDFLDKNIWIKNQPSILWQKGNYELVYLFYLLNEKQRDIPNGTITDLLSKTFKSGKRNLKEENLSKGLSKFLKVYIIGKNKKQMPQYLKDIESIYINGKSEK